MREAVPLTVATAQGLRMFKNMGVRKKLIAAVFPPLVVLGVLAGLGARQRLAEVDDALAVERFAELAAANAEVLDELQVERKLSAAYVASGGTVSGAELDAQRSVTHDAVMALVPAGEGMDPDAMSSDVGGHMGAAAMSPNLTERMNAAGVLAVDRLSDQLSQDIYTQMSSTLIDVNAGIATGVSVPDLAVGMDDYLALTRAKEAESQLASIVAAAITSGGFADGELEVARALSAESARQLTGYYESEDLVRGQLLRSALSSPEVLRGDETLSGILESGSPSGIGVADWLVLSDARQVALAGVEDAIISDVLAGAERLRESADNALRLYLAGAAVAVLLALLLVWVVGRTIIQPLGRLTASARTLANERLPALVDQLRNPRPASDDALASELRTIDIDSNDEIGTLAKAFNSVQKVTIDVAEEQGVLLRKGISDIFVNLARRNQALLDRQIEFIDGLERDEGDPDHLENLFKLDHLATRMRRNAESILVLAGAEPARRRGSPVALADVVRAAIGEVDDFARVDLVTVDEVTVGGSAADDVAHLLAELMENATQFSPPETHVEVSGHRAKDGEYVLSMSDHGIGMTPEQMAEANERLANPPLVGLAMSRSLGFIVVGRLAGRLGISVRLVPSSSGGVTALVGLPPGLIAEGSGMPGDTDDHPRPQTTEPETAPPETLLDALPEGDAFEEGLASLLSGDAAPGPIEREAGGISTEPAASAPPPLPPPPPQPLFAVSPQAPAAGPPPPPPASPNGDRTDGQTSAGLVRRAPKAAEADASEETAGVRPSHRTPEQVRQMLSRYRTGLRRGRLTEANEEPSGSDDQTTYG